MAVVTYDNLTRPGLLKNIEYGVALAEITIVEEIRADFESYSLLGAKISESEIAAFAGEMQELKELYKKAQQSIRSRARRAFAVKLAAAKLR